MPITPITTSPEVLEEKIAQMLERNGKLSDAEWRQLTSYMMQDIRADVKTLMELPAAIRELRKKNVILWAENHPKLAASILVPLGVILVLNIIEYAPVIEKAWAFISQLL